MAVCRTSLTLLDSTMTTTYYVLSKTPNEAVYSSTVYRNAGGRNRNCFPIERVFWSSCDPFQVGNDAVFFILVIRVV